MIALTMQHGPGSESLGAAGSGFAEGLDIARPSWLRRWYVNSSHQVKWMTEIRWHQSER